MKDFLKKLGFHKMDEMEMAINLKSLRIVYLFTVAYLVIWLVCILVSSGFNPNQVYTSWAFLLLITQNVILLGSQQIMKANMDKGSKDEE